MDANSFWKSEKWAEFMEESYLVILTHSAGYYAKAVIKLIYDS